MSTNELDLQKAKEFHASFNNAIQGVEEDPSKVRAALLKAEEEHPDGHRAFFELPDDRREEIKQNYVKGKS